MQVLTEWREGLPPCLRDDMKIELAETDRIYVRLFDLEQEKDIVLPSYFKEYRTVAKHLQTKVKTQVETD